MTLVIGGKSRENTQNRVTGVQHAIQTFDCDYWNIPMESDMAVAQRLEVVGDFGYHVRRENVGCTGFLRQDRYFWV